MAKNSHEASSKTNLKTKSLAKRITLAFVSFSLLLSLFFSALNLIQIYIVEDKFFAQLLKEEVAYINDYWQENQTLPAPRKNYLAIYQSVNEFPDDLHRAYQQQPKQREYRGNNDQHYHLYYFKTAKHLPKIILVAEVSDYLIVRPLKAQIITILAIVSVFLVLIAVILAYFLAKRTTKPLQQLSLIFSNEQNQSLPTGFAQHFKKDEIGLLAQKLDDAMARIDAFISREQHFTRDVSHELRTPVTIVKNAIELIQQTPLTEEQRLFVQRIKYANQQMEQTIIAMLSLAREDKLIQQSPIALLPLVEQAIIDQAYYLEGKEVEVTIDIAPKVQILCPSAIVQVLLNNILGNAFSYTQQGSVTISWQNNTLIIADTSGGFDEKIADKVMQTSVKSDNSQGYGIGLSLIKRLSDYYDISLSLSSNKQGVSVTLNF